jgi:hypothetical protein
VENLYTLHIQDACSLFVAVIQVLLYLLKRLKMWSRSGANGTMPTGAVASTSDENYTLQGFPPPQEAGSEEPPS